MALDEKHASIEILAEKFDLLQKRLAKNLILSFTEAGEYFGKNPSVIAQYAKAGLIHPIQQGHRKLILSKDLHLMEVFFYLAERYNCSYVTCKLIKAFIEDKGIEIHQYLDYVKSIENKAKITEKEVLSHVNSYRNRGTFQKQKNRKSE